MTAKELIDELSKMPPDHEVTIVLNFNEYPEGADSEMDLEEIIAAGTPCTLFPEEENRSVTLIAIPTSAMETVWNLARNTALKPNWAKNYAKIPQRTNKNELLRTNKN